MHRTSKRSAKKRTGLAMSMEVHSKCEHIRGRSPCAQWSALGDGWALLTREGLSVAQITLRATDNELLRRTPVECPAVALVM